MIVIGLVALVSAVISGWLVAMGMADTHYNKEQLSSHHCIHYNTTNGEAYWNDTNTSLGGK